MSTRKVGLADVPSYLDHAGAESHLCGIREFLTFAQSASAQNYSEEMLVPAAERGGS
jgi:hypothetical protein